jgi:hypothetical protein
MTREQLAQLRRSASTLLANIKAGGMDAPRVSAKLAHFMDEVDFLLRTPAAPAAYAEYLAGDPVVASLFKCRLAW